MAGFWGLVRRLILYRGLERTLGPAAGYVLELGIGSGPNLRHFRRAQRLVGLDPRPQALRCAGEARERLCASLPRGTERRGDGTRPAPMPASGRPAGLALVCARGEALPFSMHSFDCVAGSLVFCSVEEPLSVLAEVRRVLRPGGVLRLVEHVLPTRGPLRGLIARLAPRWHRLSGECRLDRDTPSALRAAHFALREERRGYGGVLVELVAVAPGEDAAPRA